MMIIIIMIIMVTHTHTYGNAVANTDFSQKKKKNPRDFLKSNNFHSPCFAMEVWIRWTTLR